MADYDQAMKRLDRVEAATANILVEQSERIDGVSERLCSPSGALTERLDRLIAVTMVERTAGAERLLEIERRLARLEDHVGI